MLPIVLVILVATSALAYPVIDVDVVSYNDIPYESNKIAAALDSLDGGDRNVYDLSLGESMKDLINLSDRRSKALAYGQAIALLGEQATGIAGDACAASQLIDSYVNNAGVRKAVYYFISNLASKIDLIQKLTTNPDSLRYLTGSRGKCNAGGRVYQFEKAWDIILDSASPGQIKLYSEQYCSTKRLYSALRSRSNNLAAAITAVSLPPVQKVLAAAYVPVSRFVDAVGTGNCDAYAAEAKAALLRAAENF